MKITTLSEILALVIAPDNIKINETERSWSLGKGFFLLCFLHFGYVA